MRNTPPPLPDKSVADAIKAIKLAEQFPVIGGWVRPKKVTWFIDTRFIS